MKKINLLFAVPALMLGSATVQAQGYRVNQNWINGNGNTVANVNQGGPAPTTGGQNNLGIYNQPKGTAAPQVVNQTVIKGDGNKVVNVNPTTGFGPVFQGPTFPAPGSGQQLVNLKPLNYPNPVPAPVNGSAPQTVNLNQIQGNNNAIVNAVQNSLANGLPTGPGLGPVNINVNLTVNTIIGNNNQIVNQVR